MVKYILVSLMVIALSCSNNDSGSSHAPDHPATKNNEQKLQLNNGKKWKLDEATRQNIKELKTYLAAVSDTKNPVSYNQLQGHTDKLIKECSMTGASHDALHVWLNAFLQYAQAIKNNSNVEEASHALNEDVKQFDNYFE